MDAGSGGSLVLSFISSGHNYVRDASPLTCLAVSIRS